MVSPGPRRQLPRGAYRDALVTRTGSIFKSRKEQENGAAGTSGTPKTGGRQKGTPNKATLEIKHAARNYAPEALKELARLASKAESEAARVAAIREILDRAYGKPAQAVTGEGGEGPVQTVLQIVTGVPRAGDSDEKQIHVSAANAVSPLRRC
jgi:hypothetical protein